MIARRHPSRRRGISLVLALGALGAMLLLIAALAGIARQARRGEDADERRLHAAWLLQAGAERAAIRLRRDPDYTGETWTLAPGRLGVRDAAEVRITIAPGTNPETERTARVEATLSPNTTRRTHLTYDFPIHIEPNETTHAEE